jgi:hypothetical protein
VGRIHAAPRGAAIVERAGARGAARGRRSDGTRRAGVAQVNIGQHWYPPEYYEKLPGPVVPLPPDSAAAPHAAAHMTERVEAEAAPGQGRAGGDAMGDGTGGQMEL